MKTIQQKVGRKGEDEACEFLRARGHFILARNWRSAHLELDIVSQDCLGIHITEVKSVTAPVLENPVLKVDSLKRKRLVRAASAFLRSQDRMICGGDCEVFFDVITVVFDNGSVGIEYYPQAFVPIYV